MFYRYKPRVQPKVNLEKIQKSWKSKRLLHDTKHNGGVKINKNHMNLETFKRFLHDAKHNGEVENQQTNESLNPQAFFFWIIAVGNGFVLTSFVFLFHSFFAGCAGGGSLIKVCVFFLFAGCLSLMSPCIYSFFRFLMVCLMAVLFSTIFLSVSYSFMVSLGTWLFFCNVGVLLLMVAVGNGVSFLSLFARGGGSLLKVFVFLFFGVVFFQFLYH